MPPAKTNVPAPGVLNAMPGKEGVMDGYGVLLL